MTLTQAFKGLVLGFFFIVGVITSVSFVVFHVAKFIIQHVGLCAAAH